MLSGCAFKPVWANDFNKYAVDTYNLNFGNHCVVGDIVSILENNRGIIPRADMVIGGPPCQGFILLNKKRDGDPRKSLWKPFMDIVDLSGAEYFVMENVPQLLNTDEHAAILERASVSGFNTWSGVLKAVEYGVPQTRKRAFIIGAKNCDPNVYFPPGKSNFDPSRFPSAMERELSRFKTDAIPYLTVRDAISDLPRPVGTEVRNAPPPLDLHFGRNPTEKSLQRYMAILDEGMNRVDLLRNAPEITPDCWVRKKEGGTDLFGRLWWDRPAFTIRTEFYKPEKGRYLHPDQHRPLTHREAARLQTFPDSFRFSGTKIEIARQIGNAVPPRLAAVVTRSVYAMAGASIAVYA